MLWPPMGGPAAGGGLNFANLLGNLQMPMGDLFGPFGGQGDPRGFIAPHKVGGIPSLPSTSLSSCHRPCVRTCTTCLSICWMQLVCEQSAHT
jgi:hypothetical protein